ncbi:hypothetical protein [Nonomuraea sp. NPDC048826]|uniref:hypothetical protein n=1 Tax=Nonomuraea sp. NPDC048826 TaxID=3364347 RepID=UPI00371BD299
MATTYPNCYRPDLANSLTNLGATFLELGARLKQRRCNEKAELGRTMRISDRCRSAAYASGVNVRVGGAGPDRPKSRSRASLPPTRGRDAAGGSALEDVKKVLIE